MNLQAIEIDESEIRVKEKRRISEEKVNKEFEAKRRKDGSVRMSLYHLLKQLKLKNGIIVQYDYFTGNDEEYKPAQIEEKWGLEKLLNTEIEITCGSEFYEVFIPLEYNDRKNLFRVKI